MRILFTFMCVLALGVMGCSETAGTGGGGGTGGSMGQEFPCTEQGIRDAIAEGGGPHTFDCDGPTTVLTEAAIEIDNDVVLDGEGNLVVDGNAMHQVFSVTTGVTAELRALTVQGGREEDGGGIRNRGQLTLTNSTVSGNLAVYQGGGIDNLGQLILTNSTVSDNSALYWEGGGIYSEAGQLTLTNSTVSGNSSGQPGWFEGGGGGIAAYSSGLMLNYSTVSNNSAKYGSAISGNALTLRGSLVHGDCARSTISNGYNVESPGDTCGFDPDGTDQVGVTEGELNLGELANNGGPTMTHALGAGSVAIDQIPAVDCVDAEGEPLTTDQRGEPRPETDGTMCDVGSVEVQPEL